MPPHSTEAQSEFESKCIKSTRTICRNFARLATVKLYGRLAA